MTPIEQAKTCEPIFLLHPEENWWPVQPAAYLGAARLWLAKSRSASGMGKPDNWGRCTMPEADRRFVPPSQFAQGAPLIPRGQISVNPADEQSDYLDAYAGPMYLGHDETGGLRDTDCCDRQFPFTQTTASCENFLEVSGWKATAELASPSPQDEDYTEPNLEAAMLLWKDPAHDADRYAHWVDIFEAADALDEEVLAALSSAFQDADSFRVMLFYTLFPCHEEAGMGSTRADYEGDWACFAVIAPSADAAATAARPPVVLGYGSRDRSSQRNTDSFLIRFPLQESDALPNLGGHPKVYVEQGTHNLASQPGGDPSAASQALSDALAEIQDKAQGALDSAQTAVDTAIFIAKIAAGAALGGWFGAAIGAIVAAIEAATSSPPQLDLGSPDAGMGADGRSSAAVPDDSTGYGTIIAPEAVLGNVPEAALAAGIVPWQGALERYQVERDQQCWWPDPASQSVADAPLRPAYSGRWGVRCAKDNQDRRSGMPFPDFLAALNRSLLVALSQDHRA